MRPLLLLSPFSPPEGPLFGPSPASITFCVPFEPPPTHTLPNFNPILYPAPSLSSVSPPYPILFGSPFVIEEHPFLGLVLQQQFRAPLCPLPTQNMARRCSRCKDMILAYEQVGTDHTALWEPSNLSPFFLDPKRLEEPQPYAKMYFVSFIVRSRPRHPQSAEVVPLPKGLPPHPPSTSTPAFLSRALPQICCPPPSAEGTPGTSSRGVPEGKLRRRRHRSSGIRSREAETRRKARVVAGGGGASSRKVAIGPVQEHQEEARAPSSDAAVTAAVAVISTKGDDGPAQVGIPEA